jgi:hypothetical protein
MPRQFLAGPCGIEGSDHLLRVEIKYGVVVVLCIGDVVVHGDIHEYGSAAIPCFPSRFSFTLGFLLLGIFPTDIATSAAVAARLARQGDPWWNAIPFILLTVFLLGLPALLVVVLGKRAHVFLPKVRDWMNTNYGSSAKS